jgi:hypothetical protein
MAANPPRRIARAFSAIPLLVVTGGRDTHSGVPLGGLGTRHRGVDHDRDLPRPPRYMITVPGLQVNSDGAAVHDRLLDDFPRVTDVLATLGVDFVSAFVDDQKRSRHGRGSVELRPR